MRHHSIGKYIAFGVMAALAFVVIGGLMALAFGYATMWLWNWVVPPVLGLKAISFWQAFALLLLSWIFFGRFRGGHHWHGRRWRRRWTERWMERWERMSPEEREKFRQDMRSHWRGHYGHHHDTDEGPGGEIL